MPLGNLKEFEHPPCQISEKHQQNLLSPIVAIHLHLINNDRAFRKRSILFNAWLQHYESRVCIFRFFLRSFTSDHCESEYQYHPMLAKLS